MAGYYRQQVEHLEKALNADENRAEAADLIRSLVDRIVLTPNNQGKLDINLFGDLAGILSMAANKDRPLQKNDPSVLQVKMVAGASNQRYLHIPGHVLAGPGPGLINVTYFRCVMQRLR